MNRPRKPAALLAAVAAALTLLTAACTSSSASSGDYTFHGATKLGTLIPADKRQPAADFDGGRYNLKQDDGKVTVINFWGSWCGPCKVETPQFAMVYDKYRTKGVGFVGIDVKEADRSDPRAFVKDNKVTYPIVYDEPGETALRLGDIPTQGMPFTVILDQQHRVAAVYLLRLAAADLEPVLNKLLAE
jgi:thiol-disulfide isomerase/thioredoxin